VYRFFGIAVLLHVKRHSFRSDHFKGGGSVRYRSRRPSDVELRTRLRDLANQRRFIDLDQARRLIGAWVADYNTARPHSSLGYKTPAAYAGTLIAPKGVTSVEALIAAG
jgi:transposase InsO family protein